jgi:4-amino-4-deoxy-L-arabinose transferase-like glycosyltransferase
MRAMWPILAILTLAGLLLSLDLTEPFVGHHDFNTAWVTTIARNHLRYGLGTTGLLMVMNNAQVPPDWLWFYTSHPPLLPTFVAPLFTIVGVEPWAARLPFILFTLGSIVLVYLLGRQVGGRGVGLFAAFVFAVMPMTAYFGRVANFEPPTAFFILLAVLTYTAWQRTRRSSALIATAAAVVVAALIDWPGYYLAALLPLHHLVTSPRRKRDWKVALLPVFVILLFASQLALTQAVAGEGGLRQLVAKFLLRTATSAGPEFSWPAFAARQAGWAVALFTLPVLVLAPIGVWSQARTRRWEDSGAILILLGAGALNVLLFPHGAFAHDFWLYYCAAPLALLAAVGALSLRTKLPGWVIGIMGAAVLASALPTLRALHADDRTDIMPVAKLLADATGADEAIYTNDPRVSGQAPQVGFFAGRDVAYTRAAGVSQLRWVRAREPGRAVALFINEDVEGSTEFASTLSSITGVTHARLDGPFSVFRLPPLRPGS